MTTYWDYLKLNSLLALQTGLDGDDAHEFLPGELHFIVVHQVTELWFALALEQLRLACSGLEARQGPTEHWPDVVGHLTRVVKVLQASTSHWELVEALPVQEFLRIRDKVIPASGAQSFQIAAFEILLGLEEAMRAEAGQTRSLDHLRAAAAGSPDGPQVWAVIEQARREQTFRGALYRYLQAAPICGSLPHEPEDDEIVEAFVARYVEAVRRYYEAQWRAAPRAHGSAVLDAKLDASIRASTEFLLAHDRPESERPACQRRRAVLVMVDTYTDVPALVGYRSLIDSAMELEHQFVLWRTRHVRSVERLIGNRVGTGGGSLAHLERTLAQRVLTDLWAARTVTIPRLFAPELSKAHFRSLEGRASC